MPLLFQLQFSINIFFWLLACIALGIGYAFLLYGIPSRTEGPLRKMLFGLRVALVAFLAFLLFAPEIKLAKTILEKPLIILVQDNSASIGVSEPRNFNSEKYVSDFKALNDKLSQDYEVKTFSFGDDIKAGLNFNYDRKLTDISALLQMVNDQYAVRNIGAVIIATDGIYNHGGNPLYESQNLKAPLYTIALGDTIPKRDLLIANVNYNNIVYLDNQFQIEITVEAYQSSGASTVLTVSDKDGRIFNKPLTINSGEYRITVPVTVLASKKGTQKYTINVAPISSELSKVNNTQTIFIDVVDGKQKILIVANSPNPDLSALKQSIETNKNYEVKIDLIDDFKNEDLNQAGLLILHQLPSATNKAENLLKAAAGKPIWFIIGAQSNTSYFSSIQNGLNIVAAGANAQEALATVKNDFYAFTLTENTRNRLQSFAPLTTMFGNYAVKGPASVLLAQKIGRIETDKPLLLFADEPERKIGVLAGEGLWKWRLEDFQENGNHETVDELLVKTVQYLSSRNDKRKFRVYPARTTFDENEHVVLNAELYNDSYELVNTPDVQVVLKGSNKKNYTFQFSRTNNAYTLDAGLLPSGEYSFTANTLLGKEKLTATGQFVINQQQSELQQTTANHQLLYSMAKQNGGKMVYPAEISSLPDLIHTNEKIKTVSYEDRRYEDMINLKLIFFILLALVSVEWFSRKRNGEV
ncbi:MAG TPA: hypothetical protein DIT07_09430 [Sphingobacteriaceae bacterium]|nr:hypothetical protein [Sphingobacteriaceae bacterium]